MKLTMVLLALVTVAAAQVDKTVQPGATGSDVVEAVCDNIEAKCIFPEDKLFTRRLAYVESHDGLKKDTFRSDYHGGIWQVDREMFNVTQSLSAHSVLTGYFDVIRRAFGIEWSSITWNDLTKPLHSALAARLYLTYEGRNGHSGIPRDIPGQANYWQRYYRPGGDTQHFVDNATLLEQGCTSSLGPDIVFVLDGSGSILKHNFDIIKDFVVNVVESFDIGKASHQTQVAVIKYSSGVRREFDLKTYSNKSQVINAVRNIVYEEGGTNTHLALDEMTNTAFTTTNGARPVSDGHPRVGIVVTDGESNDKSKTVAAALRAHNAALTVFAIGVGPSIDNAELRVIASDPVCTYLMLLAHFTEFDSLRSAIEKKTCEAPIIISPEQNDTIIHLPSGGDQNCKIKVSPPGINIQLTTEGGTVTFYVANSSYPSSAYYELKTEASPGLPGFIYVAKNLTQGERVVIFCNLDGDEHSRTNSTIDLNPGPEKRPTEAPTPEPTTEPTPEPTTPAPVDPCDGSICEHGDCEDLTGSPVFQCDPGYTETFCETDIVECSSDPCQHGSCEDEVDGYSCICDKGWTGIRCECRE